MMFETNLAGRLDIDLRIEGPGGKCVIRAEKKHCIRNDRSEIEMRDFIRQKKIKKKKTSRILIETGRKLPGRSRYPQRQNK